MDTGITILGSNGNIGHAAAQAFTAAGWRVTGFGRSDRRPVPGMRFVQGDAGSVEQMRAAIGDNRVVLNGLNLPYPDWGEGRMEALHERVAEAMGRDGRTMLFPANIYIYPPDAGVITPDLAPDPPTPRGAIRVRVERMLAEAAGRGDLQVLMLRAGDFYGGEGGGDWFDYIMLREAAKRKLASVGSRGVGHAWAYLPDLARAFEVLARQRGTFGAFETFHYAGHFVTPEQMAAAIVAAAPVPLKVGRFPLAVLPLLGLFSPLLREVAKMDYLWKRPLALADSRLDALLGPDFGTPFGEAVARTVPRFFADAHAAG